MNTWKIRLEQSFGQWGMLVCRHPKKIVLTILIFIGVLATFIPNLRIDTSIEGFLSPSDPEMLIYRQFQRDYGRDEYIVISLENDKIFSLDFLRQLKSYHQALELEVPYVLSVDSLVNVRSIYGAEDELVIEDLLEEFPENDADLAVIQARVASNPMYINAVISEDGRMTTVIVKLQAWYSDPKTGERRMLGDPQLAAVLQAIDSISEQVAWPEGTVKVSGSQAITGELSNAMMKDVARFMVITILMISVMLYILFRRVLAVILPLLTVYASMFSTIAIMVVLEQPFQLPTTILPSFLISVGVGNSIHFLTMFFQEFNQGRSKVEAINYALSHSGLAMLLTSLTTAVGLASFIVGDMVPISNLGLFSAIGVLLAFSFTVILLPALMMLVTVKRRPVDENKKTMATLFIDRIIQGSITLSTSRPKTIVVCGLILGVSSIAIAAQLELRHNPMEWINENSKVRVATKAIDARMGGTIATELIIDTGKDRGVIDPEFLRRLDRFGATLKSYSSEYVTVGNVIAVSDIVKETNKALFDNEDKNYIIPDGKELIAQELFLVETGGADNLFQLVDTNYRQVRMTVVLPWLETMRYTDFIHYVENEFDRQFQGSAELTVTGLVSILLQIFSLLIVQMSMSYMIASIVIMLMMTALLGSFRYGCVSMLPNFIPISIVLAMMKLADDPLDVYSMLIGSIALGLAVDDTIHFMHNFQRYFHLTGNTKLAIEKTLQTSGRAMLMTTIVLSCGFFIYMFSEMNNLSNFGFYTGLCIIFALLADFLFAPALMVLMHRKSEEKIKIEASVRGKEADAEGVSGIALN